MFNQIDSICVLAVDASFDGKRPHDCILNVLVFGTFKIIVYFNKGMLR